MNRRRINIVFSFFIVGQLMLINLTTGNDVMAKCEIDNPYATVDWNAIEYLHSVSHQHSGHAEKDVMRTLDKLWSMGIRHLPLSNYYPSRPIYPLPSAFLEKHPEALSAPNAEHAAMDSGDFNGLGSFYTAGSAQRRAAPAQESTSPFECVLSDLTVFDPDNDPWRGIYTLAIAMENPNPATMITLTVEGAKAIDREKAIHGTYDLLESGVINNRQLNSVKSLLLRIESGSVHVRIEFDPQQTTIKEVVIKQMGWRPWREAFRAALDGTRRDADSNPIEGMLYPDAGGITLNHPAKEMNFYLEKLDFDPRVLGIEVWNAHFGFGVNDTLHFYQLWDDILRTGRRCFGFFVKDHFLSRVGRNVLLVPASSGLSREQRQHNALRAYQHGAFFGLLGAVATDENGKQIQPFDCSEFRFTRIAVLHKADNEAEGIEAVVAGADHRVRPKLQIRFITETGIALVVDGESRAVFNFPRDSSGKIACRFVRIEAFAYPDALRNGERLTAERMAAMDVREIARLHDWRDDWLRPMPIPIVDMIFSQPIMIRK